jgi:hypothetical protein
MQRPDDLRIGCCRREMPDEALGGERQLKGGECFIGPMNYAGDCMVLHILESRLLTQKQREPVFPLASCVASQLSPSLTFRGKVAPFNARR